MLVGGIVKTLATADVLNDIINKSGASEAASLLAKNAIKTVPDARKIFIFKGLVDKIIKVEDILEFVKVVNKTTSDKWDDVLEAWKVSSKYVIKTLDDFWSKIPPERLADVKNGFDGQIVLKFSNEDIVLYRVWGGGAKESGSWLSSTRYSGKDAKKMLALPKNNTAENLTAFKIKKGTPYIEGKVASKTNDLKDFGEYAEGGGTQIYILYEDLDKLIKQN